ncbi:MAG: hypothetical protein AAGF98_09500 [Cyanobacteria bacterium P01_H01_bin.153]
MTLIICPGVHDAVLSDRFLWSLNQLLQQAGESLVLADQVLPTSKYWPFDGFAVWSFLQMRADPQAPLLLIGFSAGVVGAIAAANLWQAQGRAVAAVIALDGWGVPQVGDFPLHRVSHDHFTHWSSALLGAAHDSFYAAPAITHLALWQFPERAQGVSLWQSGQSERTTAIAFIAALITRYGGCE